MCTRQKAALHKYPLSLVFSNHLHPPSNARLSFHFSSPAVSDFSARIVVSLSHDSGNVKCVKHDGHRGWIIKETYAELTLLYKGKTRIFFGSWHHKPLSHLCPNPYGQGYFSQTIMHINTHWDESDHWVRWPLSSQLSHWCRSLQKWLHIRHVTRPWPLLLHVEVNFSSAVSILWQAAIWRRSCKEYRCSARIPFLSPTPPFFGSVSLSLFLYRLIYPYVLNRQVMHVLWWRGSTKVGKQTIIIVKAKSLFVSAVSSIWVVIRNK